MKRLLIIVLTGLMFLGLARAQEATASSLTEAGPVELLRVRAREVEISAYVVDKRGGLAGELTKDDFVVQEDGQERRISFFHHGLSRPLTLAILVDTSGSQQNFVEDEVGATALFLEGFIDGKQNRATIVQFDRTASQLGNLTNSASSLKKTLPLLASQIPREIATDRVASGWTGSTVLNDAVYATSKTIFSGQPGRKVIVLLTDGCDIGSKTTLAQAVEQAQRADAVVYSIYYSSYDPAQHKRYPCGAISSEGDNPGLAVLKDLSSSTGGGAFEVSAKTPLRSVFTEVAKQLQDTYELAYAPGSAVLPNSFHRITVRVRDKHYTVRARQGFYASP